MGIKNFNVREAIFCGFDDPEPGTVWNDWWQGKESKVPHYLAHLMWWGVAEACDCFVSPERTWKPPSEYDPQVIGVHEIALQNVENDLNKYIERVQSLKSDRRSEVIEPYEYESLAWQDELLKPDYVRSMAAYILYCYDVALTGLLTENARLSAIGIAYANAGLDMMRCERPDSDKLDADRAVRSELGRRGAAVTHIRTAAMKREAIRLYEGRGDWPSRRQAARAICPLVQEFGKEKYQRPLSPDRAEQTIYEWLSEHDKSKAKK